MVYIYILKLKDDKYYVGRTTHLSNRLEDHINPNAHASAWTTLYPPIEIFDVISDCDNFDEDKYTIKYMEIYGIDNVRGGSFVQKILSPEQISIIQNMINGASDKCFTCGESGHFATDCIEFRINKKLEKYKIDKNNIDSIIENFNKVYEHILKLENNIRLCTDITMELIESAYDKNINITINNLDNELYEARKSRNKEAIENVKAKKNTIGKLQNINILYTQLNIPNKNELKCNKIKAIEILKFKIGSQTALKNYYKEHHNKEFIEKLLESLHKLHIKYLESE